MFSPTQSFSKETAATFLLKTLFVRDEAFYLMESFALEIVCVLGEGVLGKSKRSSCCVSEEGIFHR